MNSYDEIIKLLKDKKVAIINNAKLETEDRTSSNIICKELEKHNITSSIIDLNKDEFIISHYDAIYLCGGEPKYLMDAIISNGYYSDIDVFISNGSVIIAQSAGAMIMHQKYVDTSTGKLVIKENGFNFSDKMIVPHYENLPLEIINQISSGVIKIKDTDRLIKL